MDPVLGGCAGLHSPEGAEETSIMLEVLVLVADLPKVGLAGL